MNRRVLIALVVLSLATIPGVAVAQLLYAVSGAGGGGGTGTPSTLYQLNPADGSLVATIGATGTEHLTGIACHPQTGVLYAVRSDIQDSGDSELYTLDRTTGVATLVGTTGFQIPDISFDPTTGTLYGWAEFDGVSGFDDLVTIDLALGTATVVGDCGCSTQNTGLAFDSGGTLYMTEASGAAELHEVNPGTGGISSTVALSAPIDNMLAFDAQDTLYGGDRTPTLDLLTIDLAGNVSIVGNSGLNDMSAIAFCDVPTVPGNLLATTANNNALIAVDTATGAGTFRTPTGAFAQLTDLEMRDDGTLFASGGGGNPFLITIDPATGIETFIGDAGTNGAVQALEFVGNTLYGTHVFVGNGPSDLVIVDQTNGLLAPVGATGFGPVGGLAYDAATGTMYGSTSGNAGGDLITIDLTLGTGALVGPTGFTDVAALEFGPDGVLYGGLGGQDASPGDLVMINPAGGAGVAIGPTGFTRVNGLAFAVGCPQNPATGCTDGFEKALLLSKENVVGKEKLIAKWIKGPMLMGSDFGDPTVAGGTATHVCVYGDGVLAGSFNVPRAGQACGTKDCWKGLGNPAGTKGYRYRDKDVSADGMLVQLFKPGDAGKSKVIVKGKNNTTKGQLDLPVGVAGALAGSSSATIQLFGSDTTTCISEDLPTVTRDDGDFFKAKKP